MKACFELETVLAPLAPVFRGQLDVLLDLRENVVQEKNAGNCIASYFALSKTPDLAKRAELRSLKNWLEDNIEIIARDGNGLHLETRPLLIHHESLTSFCQSIISDFQEDRVYKATSIGITFSYKTKKS